VVCREVVAVLELSAVRRGSSGLLKGPSGPRLMCKLGRWCGMSTVMHGVGVL